MYSISWSETSHHVKQRLIDHGFYSTIRILFKEYYYLKIVLYECYTAIFNLLYTLVPCPLAACAFSPVPCPLIALCPWLPVSPFLAQTIVVLEK